MEIEFKNICVVSGIIVL